MAAITNIINANLGLEDTVKDIQKTLYNEPNPLSDIILKESEIQKLGADIESFTELIQKNQVHGDNSCETAVVHLCAAIQNLSSAKFKESELHYNNIDNILRAFIQAISNVVMTSAGNIRSATSAIMAAVYALIEKNSDVILNIGDTIAIAHLNYAHSALLGTILTLVQAKQNLPIATITNSNRQIGKHFADSLKLHTSVFVFPHYPVKNVSEIFGRDRPDEISQGAPLKNFSLHSQSDETEAKDVTYYELPPSEHNADLLIQINRDGVIQDNKIPVTVKSMAVLVERVKTLENVHAAIDKQRVERIKTLEKALKNKEMTILQFKSEAWTLQDTINTLAEQLEQQKQNSYIAEPIVMHVSSYGPVEDNAEHPYGTNLVVEDNAVPVNTPVHMPMAVPTIRTQSWYDMDDNSDPEEPYQTDLREEHLPVASGLSIHAEEFIPAVVEKKPVVNVWAAKVAAVKQVVAEPVPQERAAPLSEAKLVPQGRAVTPKNNKPATLWPAAAAIVKRPVAAAVEEKKVDRPVKKIKSVTSVPKGRSDGHRHNLLVRAYKEYCIDNSLDKFLEILSENLSKHVDWRNLPCEEKIIDDVSRHMLYVDVFYGDRTNKGGRIDHRSVRAFQPIISIDGVRKCTALAYCYGVHYCYPRNYNQEERRGDIGPRKISSEQLHFMNNFNLRNKLCSAEDLKKPASPWYYYVFTIAFYYNDETGKFDPNYVTKISDEEVTWFMDLFTNENMSDDQFEVNKNFNYGHLAVFINDFDARAAYPHLDRFITANEELIISRNDAFEDMRTDDPNLNAQFCAKNVLRTFERKNKELRAAYWSE